MLVPEKNEPNAFISCDLISVESVHQIREWHNGTIEVVFKNGSRVAGNLIPGDELKVGHPKTGQSGQEDS